MKTKKIFLLLNIFILLIPLFIISNDPFFNSKKINSSQLIKSKESIYNVFWNTTEDFKKSDYSTCYIGNNQLTLPFNNNNTGYHINIDSNNNLYVVGRGGARDFPIYYAGEGFITKYNNLRESQYNLTYFGGDLVNYRVKVDSDNNIYTVGQGPSNSDASLRKISSSGVEVWNKVRDTPYGSFLLDLVLDGSGNIYTVGSYSGYIFSSYPIFWTNKYSTSDGSLLWSKDWIWRPDKYPGPLALGGVGSGITIDTSGDIYVTGYTEFEKRLVIIKYDSSGNKLWNTTWGSSGNWDRGNKIVSDSSNNIYITGYTETIGDGGKDVLVVSYDSNGNFRWSKTWGDTTDDEGKDIIIKSNKLYVTGYTTQYGSEDIIILSYNLLGNLINEEIIGGSGNEICNGMSHNPASSVLYLTGYNDSSSNSDAMILEYDLSLDNFIWKDLWRSFRYKTGSREWYSNVIDFINIKDYKSITFHVYNSTNNNNVSISWRYSNNKIDWSSWSSEIFNNISLNIIGRRYFQWRATLRTNTTLETPILYWLNFTYTLLENPILINGEVDPSSGYPDITEFTYKVRYYDGNNDPPDLVRVNIGGTFYDMVQEDPIDTDYTNGAVFNYTTQLPSAGNYTYYFWANSTDPLESPFVTPTFDGPEVLPVIYNVKLNPTQIECTTTPYVSFNITNQYPLSAGELLYSQNPNFSDSKSLSLISLGGEAYRSQALPVFSYGNIVYYKIRITDGGSDIRQYNDSYIVSDITAPSIQSISTNPAKSSIGPASNVEVSVEILEVGCASGIDIVYLQYTIDNDPGTIQTLQMTTNDNITYIITIPKYPIDTKIDFVIYCNDKAGNEIVSNIQTYTVIDVGVFVDIPILILYIMIIAGGLGTWAIGEVSYKKNTVSKRSRDILRYLGIALIPIGVGIMAGIGLSPINLSGLTIGEFFQDLSISGPFIAGLAVAIPIVVIIGIIAFYYALKSKGNSNKIAKLKKF